MQGLVAFRREEALRRCPTVLALAAKVGERDAAAAAGIFDQAPVW